jgi:hypothetical protein
LPAVDLLFLEDVENQEKKKQRGGEGQRRWGTRRHGSEDAKSGVLTIVQDVNLQSFPYGTCRKRIL